MGWISRSLLTDTGETLDADDITETDLRGDYIIFYISTVSMQLARKIQNENPFFLRFRFQFVLEFSKFWTFQKLELGFGIRLV
jgi:hypothetical protein